MTYLFYNWKFVPFDYSPIWSISPPAPATTSLFLHLPAPVSSPPLSSFLLSPLSFLSFLFFLSLLPFLPSFLSCLPSFTSFLPFLSFFQDSTHKWDPPVCVFLHLTSLKVMPSGSIHIVADDEIPFFFYGWIIVHCVYIPHLLYPFTCW